MKLLKEHERVVFVVSVGARNDTFDCAFGAWMCDNGMHVQAVTVTSSDDARAVAQQAAQRGAGRVVAVGGDGTLNAVVNGLHAARTQCDVGLVPMGTANDFARAAGLHDMPVADAIAHAASGPVEAIDVGEMNGRCFVNIATVGFAAALSDGVPRPLKDALGGLAYPIHGLRSVSQWRSITVDVDAGHQTWSGEALAVCVCNGVSAGGGMQLAPEAKLDDGLFDVVIVPNTTMVQSVARLLDGLLSGAQNVDGIVCIRTAAVSITSATPLPVSLDGDLREVRSLDFRILPGALRMPLGAGKATARVGGPERSLRAVATPT